jgi:hypothetical protein
VTVGLDLLTSLPRFAAIHTGKTSDTKALDQLGAC